jgi:hypothetical protein
LWVECWALKSINYDFLPVAGDSLKSAIISSKWDVESDNRVAGLDQLEVRLVDAGLGGSGVVKKSDLFKETGLSKLIETVALSLELRGSSVNDCGKRSGSVEGGCLG